MKDFHKAAMIIGVVAMLGLSLLLCFVPPQTDRAAGSSTKHEMMKEP